MARNDPRMAKTLDDVKEADVFLKSGTSTYIISEDNVRTTIKLMDKIGGKYLSKKGSYNISIILCKKGENK